mgnify:CR=1 FL=1
MTDIKVLIVDDSAVVRQVLSAVLNQASGIQVMDVAVDPVYAMEKMSRQWPDVIVLDVEMPRMDGITFLKKLMAHKPTPVVICSTLTEKGAKTTLQALAAGAVSIVTKPQSNLRQFLTGHADELIHAVRAAANANMRSLRIPQAPVDVPPRLSADAVLASASVAMARTTESIVAIGTSTGGTQALEHVLQGLPRVCPGIVVVQHMPEKFTAAFAERLNHVCEIEVREAASGDCIIPGRALIAPGGSHMLVKRSGARYLVEIVQGPPVNRHRPSVDVMFRSVARSAGSNALGIIMTGMGDDGARGLKEMRDAGARTLGQDEDSCVVYGMPREAFKLGAVERELPLEHIASAILGARGHRP